jgi:hypothetical protein
MKTNKYLSRLTFLVLAVLLTFAASAEAQRKKPTTRKTPTTKTTPITTTNTLEVRDGANKVSIQIKNVTKFLYLLGGIASGIETADKEVKSGKLKGALVEENNQNKQKVIASIRNLKAGLAALETEFNAKPSLRNYIFQIQGITGLATQSEDLATAGRFSDSGRVFLAVVEKLSDTLVAMP